MSQVKVRMDKSRYFSTVHGDRGPDDPHAKVNFYQDGLPFDAQGLLLVEAIPADDKAALAKADKLIKKASKNTVKTPPPPDGEVTDETGGADDDDGDQSGGNPDDVNLEAWLRGEQKYPWFAVTKAIRTRFAKNITKTEDAVAFLVNEQGIVAKENVAAAYQPMIG